MKKQLLIIIIFLILIFGVSSEEKNILGEWETVMYNELLEMIFEKDTLTARIYPNSFDDDDDDIFEEEKASFGVIGDLIIIEDDIYNYLLIDDKLLLIGGSDTILLKRKKEAPLFTKDMLIGKWSVEKENETVELIFDNKSTLTTTVYVDGKLRETTAVPYELTGKYIKLDDTYYLFEATPDKLFLFKNNMLLKKSE
ncbi:MAG: hypothetical protein FWF38_03625 [Spirochaetaceae bacterium]|nr:hypothetical protein [Spirochaetaceae bacterium]